MQDPRRRGEEGSQVRQEEGRRCLAHTYIPAFTYIHSFLLESDRDGDADSRLWFMCVVNARVRWWWWCVCGSSSSSRSLWCAYYPRYYRPFPYQRTYIHILVISNIAVYFCSPRIRLRIRLSRFFLSGPVRSAVLGARYLDLLYIHIYYTIASLSPNVCGIIVSTFK